MCVYISGRDGVTSGGDRSRVWPYLEMGRKKEEQQKKIRVIKADMREGELILAFQTHMS